jgi:hypothetical protein
MFGGVSGPVRSSGYPIQTRLRHGFIHLAAWYHMCQRVCAQRHIRSACRAHTGRHPADGVQCWTAVSTEQFARRAIERTLPLQVDGRFSHPDEAAKAAVTAGGAAASRRIGMHSHELRHCDEGAAVADRVAGDLRRQRNADTRLDYSVMVMRQRNFSAAHPAEMVRQVAQLLSPYAAVGAAALQSPLHASVQRWGSALYPVPDGAHDAHRGQASLLGLHRSPALALCTL